MCEILSDAFARNRRSSLHSREELHEVEGSLAKMVGLRLRPLLPRKSDGFPSRRCPGGPWDLLMTLGVSLTLGARSFVASLATDRGLTLRRLSRRELV
jgi:hypothetical protein